MHWPFIFFIEGAITVVVRIASFLFMPHTPKEARFLNEAERTAAKAMNIADQSTANHGPQSQSDIKPDQFSWHWVTLALRNWNTQLLALNFFAIMTPTYSYSLFLPTFLKGLGFNSTITQLFSVPPNFCGFLSVLIIAHFSDRYKRRGVFMLGGSTVGIAGYIMLIASREPYIQYGGTFLVASGIFPCTLLSWAD